MREHRLSIRLSEAEFKALSQYLFDILAIDPDDPDRDFSKVVVRRCLYPKLRDEGYLDVKGNLVNK